MILVTGATGLLGSTLVPLLQQHNPEERIRLLLQKGERLDALSGLTLELHYGDIRDAAAVRRAVAGARLVVHVAGLVDTAPKNPQLLFDVNVDGTRNVVAACLAEPGVRLIYVSSVHALPDLPQGETIRELPLSDFPIPDLLGPYAQSKTKATAEVQKGIAQGLDAVVVFPSGIIGPSDSRMSEMGKLFRYLSTQGSLLWVWSFRGAYDFVDVRDVAAGIIAAISKGRSGQGYILSGHRLTMPETINLVRDALGQKRPRMSLLPDWIIRLAGWLVLGFSRLLRIKPMLNPYSVAVLASNSQISHAKAAAELDYQPRPANETFRDTLTWMAEHGQIDERFLPHLRRQKETA